jgi:hypothetical protein
MTIETPLRLKARGYPRRMPKMTPPNIKIVAVSGLMGIIVLSL